MADDYKRAGWYPDPDGVPGERWWNGSGWSDSRRGGASSAASSPYVVTPPTPPKPASAPVPPAVIYSAQNPAPQRPDPYGPSTPLLSQAPGRRIPTSINASVNRNAMIGFVTGLIALFFNILFVLAPIAIVFSILGIKRANELKAQGAPTTLMTFALVGLGSGVVAGFIGLISAIAMIAPFIQLTSLQ
ncbi:hypothetical protein BH10ACT7_BH10ACT7_09360 [soil metagenome]